MKEKILSPEEAQQLLQKLQMKYGAEGQRVQGLIENDIKLYGYVTLETESARDDLTNQILKEKENYDN